MPDLEVRVLGSNDRGRRGISVKLDFTGALGGLTGQHYGFSEEKYTDSDGLVDYSFDDSYNDSSFDLYVNHKKEGDYNLSSDNYIEVNLEGDDEDAED